MARIGGVIVLLVGAALAAAAGALGLTLLGRPVPDMPGLVQLKPYLAEIAASVGAPLATPQALLDHSAGRIAAGGMVSGGLIVLAGLVQVVLGRNAASLTLLVLGIILLAVTGVLA